MLVTVFTRVLGINHWLGAFSAFLKNYLPTSSQALSKFNEYVRNNAAENYKYYCETLLDICNNSEISSISKQIRKRGCKQKKVCLLKQSTLCISYLISFNSHPNLFVISQGSAAKIFSPKVTFYMAVLVTISGWLLKR